MAPKLRIACAALLAAFALPALALQLGQVDVKSALNQPLVAAIPLHPKDAAELDDLSVALASPADFARAGLKLTATDRTLRFHVTSNNNGQKLILVTSSEPVTDPYLDFLVQVNTRDSKQVHEFVILLNPVVAASTPVVQTAPVAPVAAVRSAAQLPPSSAFPQPPVSALAQGAAPAPAPGNAVPAPVQRIPAPASAVRQAAPAPTPTPVAGSAERARAGQPITVHSGDTLFSIARATVAGSNITISQMMLALQAANPDAFFKPNINDLKAGAILRVPQYTSSEQRSVAVAAAAVLRQNEAWSAAKAHPATLLEGTVATAAARAAPKPAVAPVASDHLTLAPPTHGTGGASNRPGVAGGTGSAGVAELRRQLRADQDTLVSLKQANADLESRVRSLEDISAKTKKLLSLKDSTIAELQRKLAGMPPGKPVASAVAKLAAAPKASTASLAPHAAATAQVTRTTPWYLRPITWIVAALVLLAVIASIVLGRRGVKPREPIGGPLPGLDDVGASAPTGGDTDADTERMEPTFNPDDVPADAAPEPVDGTGFDPPEPARLDLPVGTATEAGQRGDAVDAGAEPAPMPINVAEASPPEAAMEAVPAPAAVPVERLAAEPVAMDDTPEVGPEPVADAAVTPDPLQSQTLPADPSVPVPPPLALDQPPPAPEPPEPASFDDPVDTKLDLARAYMDMDDPASARAMLDEVVEEGSQVQKDIAWRLLAKLEATAGRDGE